MPSTMTLWQGYECKILLEKTEELGSKTQRHTTLGASTPQCNVTYGSYLILLLLSRISSELFC